MVLSYIEFLIDDSGWSRKTARYFKKTLFEDTIMRGKTAQYFKERRQNDK